MRFLMLSLMLFSSICFAKHEEIPFQYNDNAPTFTCRVIDWSKVDLKEHYKECSDDFYLFEGRMKGIPIKRLKLGEIINITRVTESKVFVTYELVRK